MNFLVVDDEATARQLLAMQLEDYGTAVPAGSGEQALALAEAHLAEQRPFHLICVDLSLPGLDGLDLIEQLRALEGQRRPLYCSQIVVVSASEHARDVVGAFRRQADGYLHKPVKPGDLSVLLGALVLSLGVSA